MGKRNRFPAGWNEARVRAVLQHYDHWTEESHASDESSAVCAKRTIELLSIVAWVFLFSCGPALKEASSNFDLKDVDGFLQAVSGLVETGFGIEERNQLL